MLKQVLIYLSWPSRQVIPSSMHHITSRSFKILNLREFPSRCIHIYKQMSKLNNQTLLTHWLNNNKLHQPKIKQQTHIIFLDKMYMTTIQMKTLLWVRLDVWRTLIFIQHQKLSVNSKQSKLFKNNKLHWKTHNLSHTT